MRPFIAVTICLLFFSIDILAQIPSTLSENLTAVGTAADSTRTILYNQIGIEYLYLDKKDSAKYYLNMGKELAEKIDFPKGTALAFTNLGVYYRSIGQQELSLKMYLSAYKIVSDKNLNEGRIPLSINIAKSYSDRGDMKNALAYASESRSFAEQQKDTLSLIDVHRILGTIYKDANRIDEALLEFEKASEYCGATTIQDYRGLPRMRMVINNYIAGIYNAKGKYTESLKLLEPIHDFAIANKLSTGQNYVLANLAEAQLGLKNYPKSIEYGLQGLELLKKDSIPGLYQQFYHVLYNAYAGNGEYKPAFENFKKLKSLEDSITSKNNRQTISEMLAKFDSERKEEQIALLSKEKMAQQSMLIMAIVIAVAAIGFLLSVYRSKILQKKLFAQKETLEKSQFENQLSELEQKALRAQMNPHFIFNSLNSIQHFILDKDIEGVNLYLSNFAKLIRQTLENSGKSYISLEDEIQYLNLYLELERKRFGNKFDYGIDIAPEIDAKVSLIPGMLLQPYVENAIIHGIQHKKEGKGFLQISFTKVGDQQIRCEIGDNGIGIERAREIRALETGTARESYAMRITQDRIAVLNKQLALPIVLNIDSADKRQAETGTRISLLFPLKNSHTV